VNEGAVAGDGRFTVRAGRRLVTVDAGEFVRCGRVAVQFASHWQACFADTPGRAHLAGGYATALRSLLRYLETLPDPPSDARFVDVDMLDGWVWALRSTGSGSDHARQLATALRVLLDNIDPVVLHDSLTQGSGLLRWRPDVAHGGIPLADLTPGQWAALRKVTKRDVFAVTTRLTAVQAEAAQGGDPGTDRSAWRIRENVYWLALHGRLTAGALAAGLRPDSSRHPWPHWALALCPPQSCGVRAAKHVVRAIYRTVLPHLLDAAAFWVAMAIATGLPAESVTDLEPDWFDTPPGSSITILRYRKQRRGAPTIPLVLLASSRFSAQRLRDTYLALSAPLRTIAGADPTSARLWCYAATSKGSELFVRAVDGRSHHFPRWLEASGLLDPARIDALETARRRHLDAARDTRGERAPTRAPRPVPLVPLEAWTGPIDARRIRKTDKAHRLVLYGTGPAANDHTVRVLVAHYTNSDLVRVRSALIITGVAETLSRFAAGPRPAVVIPAAIAGEAGADGDTLAALADMLGLTVERLTAVLAGRHTVGAVACCDPYVSPHDTAGRFCRQAGSELCLTCPQAVVLAEHVPRLWAEVERLDRIATTMTPDAFAPLHAERHRLLVELLAVLDPDHLDAYQRRGVIPNPGPAGDDPARLRRRRTR